MQFVSDTGKCGADSPDLAMGLATDCAVAGPGGLGGGGGRGFPVKSRKCRIHGG